MTVVFGKSVKRHSNSEWLNKVNKNCYMSSWLKWLNTAVTSSWWETMTTKWSRTKRGPAWVGAHLVHGQVDTRVGDDAQHVGNVALVKCSKSLLLKDMLGTVYDARVLAGPPQGQAGLQDLARGQTFTVIPGWSRRRTDRTEPTYYSPPLGICCSERWILPRNRRRVAPWSQGTPAWFLWGVWSESGATANQGLGGREVDSGTKWILGGVLPAHRPWTWWRTRGRSWWRWCHSPSTVSAARPLGSSGWSLQSCSYCYAWTRGPGTQREWRE